MFQECFNVFGCQFFTADHKKWTLLMESMHRSLHFHVFLGSSMKCFEHYMFAHDQWQFINYLIHNPNKILQKYYLIHNTKENR